MSFFADVLALLPTAYWEMQEVSGTTADNAEGTAGFDGLYTAPAGSFTLGQATSFSECPLAVLFVPGALVTTSGGAIAQSQSAYTILALINTTETSFTFDRTIYGESIGSGSFNYIRLDLDASSKKLSFERNGSNGIETVVQTSGSALNDGADHLVAVVVNGLSVALYVDGAAVTTTGFITGTITSTATPVIAGMPNIFGGTGRNWSGEIASVAVFQTDLTSGNMSDLWDSLNATPCNPPVNAGGSDLPSVSGTTEVGDTLTVTPGVWTGDATIVLTYQWYRFCGSGPEELISGATGLTYELTEDDLNCDVFVREHADNGCDPDGDADSNDSGPVTCGVPTNVTIPTIAGSTAVGHTLVGSPGDWDCATTFDYEWYLDCGGGPIGTGNTSFSLTTDDSMIGCTVYFRENAHGPGGDAGSFSLPLGPIEANVPAANRFCQGPMWRFIVTDLDCQTLTFLDRIATSRTAVYTLNAPAVATGVVPSDAPEVNIAHTDGDPFVAEGNRILFGFRQEIVGGELTWVVRYGGLILQIEDIADSDNANTHYTAFDPLKYLFSRPVQTIEGNPVGVDGLSFTATRVDVIIGTLLLNTIVNNGTTHIDAGASYGGTGFYAGTIEMLPQIDINFQQGLSVGDAIKILTDQNYCDIILTPIWDPENRPGYVCELSIFAQAGAVQEDAIFAWDKPSRSLVGISRLLEGTARANNVRYFAGQGGSAGSSTVDDATSIAKYGEYWSQQFWPGQKLVVAVTALAEAALDLQKNGKETVTISPIPGCTPLPFEEYFLGDRVPVYASNRFRQEIPRTPSGTNPPDVQYQRIYGMPIDIEDDSTEMIKQMLTSEMQ